MENVQHGGFTLTYFETSPGDTVPTLKVKYIDLDKKHEKLFKERFHNFYPSKSTLQEIDEFVKEMKSK